MAADEVSDRQKLAIQCKSTIEYNFGSICDQVQGFIERGLLPAHEGEALKRLVRRHGNDAINIVANHLDYYNVTRNHRADTINPARVGRRFLREAKG